MSPATTDADLAKRIRDARRRRDDAYRRLGKHIEGCQACARADQLQGPPEPFCPAGDGLLAELAQARWELHMAAMQHMRPQPLEEDRPRPRARRASRRGRLDPSPRPFGTHPRHRQYST